MAKEQTARGNIENYVIVLEGGNALGPHSVFLLMLAEGTIFHH